MTDREAEWTRIARRNGFHPDPDEAPPRPELEDDPDAEKASMGLSVPDTDSVISDIKNGGSEPALVMDEEADDDA